tara:strand:+ start:13623 stop:15035 length:1413 start_codon:yes stop_codon:yes gene_type:complete
MANLTLNNGEVYKFGKLNGNPVCTYGSDYSHADLKIKSDVEHGNPSSYTSVQHNIYSTNTPLILNTDVDNQNIENLRLDNHNTGANADTYMVIQNENQGGTNANFSLGIDATDGNFKLTNGVKLSDTAIITAKDDNSVSIAELNSGLRIGNDSTGDNTHNLIIGQSGGSGTGANIIHMYAENDARDSAAVNEIRMYGHEGRAQGIRITDSDYADETWWCGTVYQGYQDFFSIGFDDATAEHSYQRKSILTVCSPNQGDNDGHGSVRIQDWDDTDDNSYSDDYFWVQHNGTDARLGARTGHFDFHNGGDEDSGTHNIRFGDDGSLKAYNLNSYSSGGSTVKWFSGEFKYSSSTRKVKKEIKSIKDSNSAVVNFNKLRPVEYKQKLDDAITYGFIAEEVAEVDPKLAVWDKDYARDDKGQLIDTGERIDKKVVNKLDSDKIVPSDLEDRAILALAVAKIQQLEERIKELENR